MSYEIVVLQGLVCSLQLPLLAPRRVLVPRRLFRASPHLLHVHTHLQARP